jgi:hypothetical protein
MYYIFPGNKVYVSIQTGVNGQNVIVMIPLLINQSNISRDSSLQLSKCLADSDLVVIGLTGIGPIRKIRIGLVLPYWPNESFYIVLTDLIIPLCRNLCW